MPPNKATNESIKPLGGSTNSKDQWKNHNDGHSSYNDGYHTEHSGYSDHDGYNDRLGYGSFSGHGSGCCPLVVDPLTMLALVGFIGLATYFFEIQIRNSMLARSFAFNTGWVFQGTHLYFTIRNTKTHRNLIIEAKPPNKAANKSESTTRGQHKPQRPIKKPYWQPLQLQWRVPQWL